VITFPEALELNNSTQNSKLKCRSRITYALYGESRRRVIRIMNENLGRWRKYAGEIVLPDKHEVTEFIDEDLLSDIQAECPAWTALAFWGDGSKKYDGINGSFLEAGVAWREQDGQGSWQWKE
jgi:hypothetical protein